MELLIAVLNYLGPLIGVFIGWLLARKNDKDKLIREDKRNLKRTLKALLDLRYEINLIVRDEEFISMYVEAVKVKVGELANLNASQTNQIINLLKNAIEETGLMIYKQTGKTTKKNFEKVVDGLSEIDPILAYRLNGKQNIHEFFKIWEEISEKSLAEWITEKNEIEHMMQQFRPKLLNEAINDLDSVLTEVAFQIDKTTLHKVREIITKKEIHEKQIFIQQYVDRIFN